MSHGCAGHRVRFGDAHPFALPGATEHYAPDRPVRVEHLKLEVDLDLEKAQLDGTCTTRVRAVRPVETVVFDAVELELLGATVDGKRAEATNDGLSIRVRLPASLPIDGTCEIALRYRARPRRGMYFWGPDEGYPDRPRQAWTQGQDEDSRFWFPCLDAPAQKATSEVRATFPAGMTALSNGAVVSDETKGGRRTTHYRFDHPHSPYLVTLAVGELEEVRADAGGTELRYLFPKGRQADALRCVGRTGEMLALFEELTGEKYPYGRYAQVFVTEFIFGGMENSSATTLTDLVLHDERAHQDYSAEPLVSHELAHQWFGDLLTCREWPHGWLNEGFATYFETLWKERAEGVDEADQNRRADLDEYLNEVSHRYARPIVARKFHEPIDLFDRHLYEKGGLVLHELRRRLGDEAFFRALRGYVQKNRFGSVETVDLSRAVEAATGRNLDRFVDQYVLSPGHPALKVEARYEAEEKRIRLKVSQTQKVENGVPLFALPLDVAWTGDGGEERTRLEVVDAEHVFFLDAATEPKQLRIDPRREVLGTLEVDKPQALWIEELARAPEARARTEAALALAKDGSMKAVDALGAALASDPFWATRAACARSLGRIRTIPARDALLANLNLKHPKARRAVVAALGEFRRDEQVGQALRALLKKGDPSYFVEGEAARSYGKLRLPGVVAVLEPVTARRSFQEAIAAGAIDGLAESLEPAAYPVCAALTAYGQPLHVRRAAAKAVAKLAEPAEKKLHAVELLSELLRDRQFLVQMTSFEAAESLGDRRLLAALETIPFADGRAKRAARETIRAMREGAPQAREVAALREELDKLKQETRGMKEQLEALQHRSGAGKPAAKPKKQLQLTRKARRHGKR